GGFLAGTVAVEEAFDLAVVAAQELQLAFGDGGALGGDGGLEADVPAAEGVELAFDEDKGMAFGGVLAGVVEVKEEVALAEDGGLGGVDVFGLAGGVVLGGEVGLAGGEGDDAALMVADGDHEAAAEAGLERAEGEHGAVVHEEQAALAKGVLGEFAFEQGGRERAVGGRGEADLEF